MRGIQGTAPRGGPPAKGRTAPIGGGCPGTSAGVVKVEAWWPGAECRPEGRQRPGRQGVWAQNQQHQQAGGGGGAELRCLPSPISAAPWAPSQTPQQRQAQGEARSHLPALEGLAFRL